LKMINLLPPIEKEELMIEQRKRLTIILGSFFLIVLVCFFLVLLSVDFYILGEAASQKIILEDAQKRYKTPDFINAEDIVKKYNKDLSLLKSFYEQDLGISQTLKNIADIERPEGLYFTNLFLNRDAAGGLIKVNISGFSKNRELLLAFRKNLENAPAMIKNPYFSPESWIKAENINFSLSLEIVKNEK